MRDCGIHRKSRGEPDSRGGSTAAGISGLRRRGGGHADRDRLTSVSTPAVSASRRLSRTDPPNGPVGISHTRWATHGPANDVNAHPHVGGPRRRRRRPQWRHRELHGPSSRARGPGIEVRHSDRHGGHRPPDRAELLSTATWSRRSAALRVWKGPTDSGSSPRSAPAVVVGARLGSPLVVGLGDGEHYLASDPSPRASHRAGALFLQDGSGRACSTRPTTGGSTIVTAG